LALPVDLVKLISRQTLPPLTAPGAYPSTGRTINLLVLVVLLVSGTTLHKPIATADATRHDITVITSPNGRWAWASTFYYLPSLFVSRTTLSKFALRSR
jgi:hypothetical protein